MTVGELKTALAGVADALPVWIEVKVDGGTAPTTIKGYAVVGTVLRKDLELVLVDASDTVVS